ncbi:MAG: hypothetical protein CM15mP12_7420 [Gammaproteobacteria bacterium]|nr:MAG: hypothetical protein CM15mP12_7420 [Gammaproteobacteria bacterium]
MTIPKKKVEIFVCQRKKGVYLNMCREGERYPKKVAMVHGACVAGGCMLLGFAFKLLLHQMLFRSCGENGNSRC